MEPRAYLVAVLFGLATGWGATLGRDDRTAALAVLAATTLIGVVSWLLASESIAGPSLTIGGGCALASGLGFARKKSTEVPP
ncbi:MAG TPA: hypothetical protein VLA54_08865 [Acidimicrobiia bacterium]|jgi:hypothetical protein|nr:hypothetical protein [Acidimicrobiia bacterium]